MFSVTKQRAALIGLAGVIGLVVLVAPVGGQGNGNPNPFNVNVLNTPLPVVDAQDPVHQPFGRSFSNVIEEGNRFAEISLVTVPAGKRLVIEHVSFLGRLPGADLTAAYLRSTNGTEFLVDYLVVHAQGTDDTGHRVYAASQQLRTYVEQGESVRMVAERTNREDFAVVSATISGYFVDVP